MSTSKFQTIVDIPDFKWETGYSKKNIFMGSCFTENIGNNMANLNYNVDINPFGILYNPVSVANGLQILLQEKEFSIPDLIQHDGLWHSFFHHGKFSFADKEQTLEVINNQIQQSSEYLKSADFLFITFGTAWVYKYLETGDIVSNCHKIPEKQFKRVRLTITEIVELYNKLLNKICQLNPGLKIIFTVSPIRHWKDGAVENQRSKSTLLLAVGEIIKNREENCAYFPSYEIIMDELRDYRFYTEDMIHISDVAINHIWSKFEKAIITEESRTISKKVKKLKAAANHRPFNKLTKDHLKFLQNQLLKTTQFGKNHPFINLELEKQNFINQIHEIESILG